MVHPIFRFIFFSSVLALSACGREPTPSSPIADDPQFVGSAACVDCHATQYSEWSDSHHDLAMQVADESTVLGNFEQAEFDYFGSTTQFLRRDGRFIVRTANASDEAEEFEITHTFGVTPLQQYLVAFPGGRLQSLPFAWDSRPATEGGRRWFHVYPDEFIEPGDELHWTGRQHNWNYMCAECHSTDLQVNYDQDLDSFDTRWSEINVGCEACHGPASKHVNAARNGELSRSKGLQVDLDDHGRAVWQMNLQTGIAERSEMAFRQARQPEACGRCHARRGVISADYEYGEPLAETHRVALLDARLYHDDGQILDEVYVYGSFVQSRMHRAGVTCSDCHNPHSLELHTRPEPSDICSQCHLPEKFAAAEHHRHQPDDVACVDCHMPATTYMVVDPRRDHSFRIPRPDLSVTTNAPNACNNCHADHDAAWAATAAENWWGPKGPHFASVFAEARNEAVNPDLIGVAGNTELPGIVRASAISRLSGPPTQGDAESIQIALLDADSLIRVAAVRAARMLPSEALLQIVPALLKDPVRSVRIEAAITLSGVYEYLASNADFFAAANEYRAAMSAIASRPEAHVSLGDFEASLGNPDQAIKHYAKGLSMDPTLAASRLNYADALRRFGDEAGAEKLLRDGLTLDSASAELRHSLGLLLVRTERSDDGLSELSQAVLLAPENPRFAYVEGIALNSLGQTDASIVVMQQAHLRFAGDFDIAWALATLHRDNGSSAAAMTVIEGLEKQYPGDARIESLRESMR
jgi:Flp pilus assembly protein TadD/formate-dependent nitrite reductase cytochrome c552 subunit